MAFALLIVVILTAFACVANAVLAESNRAACAWLLAGAVVIVAGGQEVRSLRPRPSSGGGAQTALGAVSP